MVWRSGKCLLRDLLKARKMTQKQLADKVGMKTSQVSDYVNNHRAMTLDTAKTIAQALECSIDDLYEWVEIRRRGQS